MACRGPDALFISCRCRSFLLVYARSHGCAMALEHVFPRLPYSPGELVRYLEAPKKCYCADSHAKHVGYPSADSCNVWMAAGKFDDDGGCRTILCGPLSHWTGVGRVGERGRSAAAIPAHFSHFRGAVGRGSHPRLTGFLGEICGKAAFALPNSRIAGRSLYHGSPRQMGGS